MNFQIINSILNDSYLVTWYCWVLGLDKWHKRSGAERALFPPILYSNGRLSSRMYSLFSEFRRDFLPFFRISRVAFFVSSCGNFGFVFGLEKLKCVQYNLKMTACWNMNLYLFIVFRNQLFLKNRTCILWIRFHWMRSRLIE